MSKRILSNVKIYVVKSTKNRVLGKNLYLDKQKAESAMRDYIQYDISAYVDSFELPFVGKFAMYIKMYRGFDYDYGYDMHDIIQRSDFYASKELVKRDKLWKFAEKRVNEDPEQFNVYDDKICSRDTFGDDWCFGDVMEENINVSIEKMKVIR